MAASLIWWLRRDLRLRDNTALAAALAETGGAVIPLCILDPALLTLAAAGPARVHFMLESLRALDEQLRQRGGRLVVRRGEPLAVLLAVLRESGAAGVVWNRDYTPRAIARDSAVKRELLAQGFSARSFKDQVLLEMAELVSTSGTPYTVYTPYGRAWRARLDGDLALAADRLPEVPHLRVPADLASDPLPAAAELGFTLTQQVMPAGEHAGLARLHDFVERQAHGIGGYAAGRNMLADDGTSRLAPHLRWGTVSVRACLRAALAARAAAQDPLARKGCDAWIGELAWRDFYQQILYHFPRVLREPFRPEFQRFAYDHAPERLQAWQEGHTGYPIVDAAMRQLNREAFMHNRARMLVASFLTKDLLLDYRLGERYFLRQLACGDLAANNGGWQWVAGCGNDAQPYFRIFNPVSQARSYDPRGEYVRRYVPELASLPAALIHQPWRMTGDQQRAYGVHLGRDYPAPIVDHAVQRAEALRRFRELRAPTGKA